MIDIRLTKNEEENLKNKENIEIAMARKLEIMLLPNFKRHIRFFYAGGNLKGKARAYRKKYDENEVEDIINNSKRKIATVCKPLCELVVKILTDNGIKAETISCDTDMFKHTDVLITTKNGKQYLLNYLEDMENIQTGMTTPDFAGKEYYERRYEKFENRLTPDGKKIENIKFLSKEELEDIDKTLGYKKYNMYMDQVIEQIKLEFSDFRNIMAENEWLTKQLSIKDEPIEIQNKIKEEIYEKYANMTKQEELESKLDWLFEYFNERMDITGHTDFVMYYSRLLLKNVLPKEEYDSLTRYDCFIYKDKVQPDSKIKNVLDYKNTESGAKLRYCILNTGDKNYVFSTKPNEYAKLNNEEIEELRKISHFSKCEKPSDLIRELCNRGNALPLVFHPLGLQILNDRAKLIDDNLDETKRKKAINQLSKQIMTIDEPITSILIPYENGNYKYLYINKNDEFVVRDNQGETIYHYDEETDEFNPEVIPNPGVNKEEK